MLAELFHKNKAKIAMLAPIIVGLIFFAYSAISGFVTVTTTKIPENFEEVSLRLNNYQVKEIDDKTGEVKWLLKGDHAETSSDETQAKVIKPQLLYNEPAFKVSSEYAYLDKGSQEVNLYNNVHLVTDDKRFKINAGRLLFAESSEKIKLHDTWQLITDQGYKISGTDGHISKDFKFILSLGDAKLNRQNGDYKLDMAAKQIKVKPETQEPIQAEGDAILNIGEEQKLLAKKINVRNDGKVFANGSVNVKATNLDCYSDRLEIIAKADKSPKTALFKGNPHVIQNGNIIYADIIRYDFDTKLVSFEGNVHSGG